MTFSSFPQRRLRLGFVGGGPESGIGGTHRYAAMLDGQYELVAGAFSSKPERNLAAARAYGVADERAYASYEEMAAREAQRANGIDVVAVMTPNPLHVPVSRAFLARGIDVICDKPLSVTYEEALDFRRYVAGQPCVFVLTHNYSGFPMVREARERVRAGEIGDIRLVQVEYGSAYGVDLPEQKGIARMVWRYDTAAVGGSSVLADLGVHAHHMLRFVTGLEVAEVAADIATLTPGRAADDNVHVMLRLDGGVRGMFWASSVAAGQRQGLQIRVYGAKGSLLWHQEDPDCLYIRPQNAPHWKMRTGEAWLGQLAAGSSRQKPGQVEGAIESFANIYAGAAELIRARREGRAASAVAGLCPGVDDGLAGMRFIEACVRSQQAGGAWVRLPAD